MSTTAGIKPRLPQRKPTPRATAPCTGQVEHDQAAQLLGAWQAQEVERALRQRECRGLTREHLEDLYQDALLTLLGRRHPWESREHLRNAVRVELRRRAPHLHRDERRHQKTLTTHAPGLHAQAHAHAARDEPEQRTIAREDQQIITEFLAELTDVEQHVFLLRAEGLRSRRIARELGIGDNDARNASRAAERKRERYARIYTTGRLCGYRATTINHLQEGEHTSEQLAYGAIAHLQHCTRCQAEHNTTARRLRHAFEQQAAAALIPLGQSFFARLAAHAKRLPQRLHRRALAAHDAHTRVAAAFANTTPARVAVPISTALIAAGAIGTTQALNHPPHRHHQPRPPSAQSSTTTRTHAATTSAISAVERKHPEAPARPRRRPSLQVAPFGPGRVVTLPAHHPAPAPARTEQQHTPGGFAYLGAEPPPAPPPQTHLPSGGGEFSP